MLRLILSDFLWQKLSPALVAVGIYETDQLRNTIEGILWRMRTGSPWRDLPTEFGSWKRVYNQFNRWSTHGKWASLFHIIRGELDSEWNFIDATIIRVHQHASGAATDVPQAIGKSKGGNSTKVSMLADAHGNPITLEIRPGNEHDVKSAPKLLDSSEAEVLIGDKGYDSEAFRSEARDKSISPCIPLRCNNRHANPEFDKHLYRHRHLIENLFARLKHYRAFATRYDKLTRNFSAVVFFACALIWLNI